MPLVLPSISQEHVGTLIAYFRGSIPNLYIPLSNASRITLRLSAHDSWPLWPATVFNVWLFHPLLFAGFHRRFPWPQLKWPKR